MVNCLPSRVRADLRRCEILCQRLVVRVARVRLNRRENRCRPHEASDVVDVAVGVVAGDAAIEPDDLIDAQEVMKGLFQLVAAHAGIALLHLAQQALLGGEQNTFAIGIDGAALENQAVLRAIRERDRWLPLGQAEKFGDAARDLVVAMPVGILGPGVEAPVGNRNPCLRHRARRSDPSRASRRDLSATGGSSPGQDWRPPARRMLARAALLSAVLHDEMHPLMASQQAHNFGVEPGDRLKLSRPVFRVMRPSQPGGFVPVPFGGHAIAQFARSLAVRALEHSCVIGYLGSGSPVSGPARAPGRGIAW